MEVSPPVSFFLTSPPSAPVGLLSALWHSLSHLWTLTFDAAVETAGGNDGADTCSVANVYWTPSGAAYGFPGGSIATTQEFDLGDVAIGPDRYTFNGHIHYVAGGDVPLGSTYDVSIVAD